MTKRTKAPLETLPCGGIHHSSDYRTVRGAKKMHGDTCPSCNNTGYVQRCSRCLLTNCDGIKHCPGCSTCDGTQLADCGTCEGTGYHDGDEVCGRCDNGQVRCPRC